MVIQQRQHQQIQQQQRQQQLQQLPQQQQNREAIQQLALRKIFYLKKYSSINSYSIEPDNKISMINILHPIMILIIGMVDLMVVIPIYMIIMVQHQLKFLNFNIHLIHCYNKMVLLNKSISNTNNNVLMVK